MSDSLVKLVLLYMQKEAVCDFAFAFMAFKFSSMHLCKGVWSVCMFVSSSQKNSWTNLSQIMHTETPWPTDGIFYFFYWSGRWMSWI